MAGLDFREDDELAEIELTYSILDDINQARPAFGKPAVCIIQVVTICHATKSWQSPLTGQQFLHGALFDVAFLGDELLKGFQERVRITQCLGNGFLFGSSGRQGKTDLLNR